MHPRCAWLISSPIRILMKAHLAWLTWLLPNQAFLEVFALRVSANTILCMNKLRFHHIWIFCCLSLFRVSNFRKRQPCYIPQHWTNQHQKLRENHSYQGKWSPNKCTWCNYLINRFSDHIPTGSGLGYYPRAWPQLWLCSWPRWCFVLCAQRGPGGQIRNVPHCGERGPL